MQAQASMSPEEYAEQRDRLLATTLRDLIEQTLLVQEAKRKLPGAIKTLDKEADKRFRQNLAKLMKQMNLETEAELRKKLEEEGTSLDSIKDMNRARFIAEQYVALKLQPRIEASLGHHELFAYYRAHLAEFRSPARVKWRQIEISFAKYPTREAARRRAEAVLAQLRQGADFARMARSFSEGPGASRGGLWDWTTRGKLASAEVENAIFSIPVGRFSNVLTGVAGYQIVKVEARVPDRTLSFEQAQDRIYRALQAEIGRRESQKMLQALVRRSQIVTIFDPPPEG